MGLTLEQNKGYAKNLVQEYCKDDIKKIFQKLLKDNNEASHDVCVGIIETQKEIEKYFEI